MRRRLVLIFSAIICQLSVVGAGNDVPTEDPQISIEEQISQLFIIEAFPGGNEKHFTVLENQVKRNLPGGLFLQNGNPKQVAALIDRMNGASKIPLWVGSDIAMSDFPMPNQSVMNQVDDPNLVRETGVLIGERLSKMGIDFILDPTLSPSSDKFYFSRFLAQGLYTEGITPLFQDLNKPNNPGGILVMYKAPEPINKRKMDYSKTPAAKLRADGYIGLVVVRLSESDIADENAALHALISGADLVIFPSDPSKSITGIKKQLKGGQLNRKKISEKYLKVLKHKYKSERPFSDKVKYLVSLKDEFIIDKLSVSSIALISNQNNILPLRMLDTLEVAVQKSEEFKTLNTYLKKYSYIYESNDLNVDLFDVFVIPVTLNTDLEQILQITNKDKVILAVFGFQEHEIFKDFPNVIAIPEINEATLRAVPQMIYGAISPSGKYRSDLPVGFSSKITFDPLQRLSYAHPLDASMDKEILTGIDKIAQEAIIEGATPGLQVLVARQGKVVYSKAFGYHSYQQKRAVTEETIYDLASVTKVLATLQGVMFMEERGLIDLESPLSDYLPELQGSNKEGILLKDILLHQAGLRPWLPFWRQTMEEDDVSDDFYSKYPEEKYPLQVSEGLFAVNAIRDSVWNWIIDTRLMKKKKGEPYGYRYSDMGFYMMQRLVESRLNQPLNEFVSQNFYDPLGMVTTTYLPLCKFEASDIAPTAEDMYFRKGLIDGLVHDEGAAMFGGVAGHSGLFSNANDLAKILQMHLQGGYYGGSRYLKNQTIELFSQKQVKDNRRGLGWDKPNVGHWRSPTSEHASAETFGHTGFTGTAVWVDPAYDLVFIFLSNRINPDAENAKLMQLNIRSRIQDIIYKAIWELDQYKVTFSPEP